MDIATADIQSLLDRQTRRAPVQLHCRAADRHDRELLRSLCHGDAIVDQGAFFRGAAMDFIERLPPDDGGQWAA